MAMLYYTLGPSPKPKFDGELMAVITNGHPQLGDTDVMVLSIGFFATQAEADAWAKIQIETKPWETRQ